MQTELVLHIFVTSASNVSGDACLVTAAACLAYGRLGVVALLIALCVRIFTGAGNGQVDMTMETYVFTCCMHYLRGCTEAFPAVTLSDFLSRSVVESVENLAREQQWPI